MLCSLAFSFSHMPQEEFPVDAATAIGDLTSQEIAAFILPVLNADEPVLPLDVEIIKKRALALVTENPALSIEDALLNAAADRLSARQGTETPVAVIDSTGYVHSVVGKGVNPVAATRAIAEDFREHGDDASDR